MATNANGENINRWIASKMRLVKRLPYIIEEEGFPEQMVGEIKDIIATSGQPTTPTSKGPGRIDKENMIDGVKARISSDSETRVNYLIGWDRADFAHFRTPEYPVIQDTGDPNKGGFTHVPDGKLIPAMHALQTTRDDFIPVIRAAIRRKLRDRSES